eukprot:1157713-Pelagomonas_calceolata.AAC.1
MRQRLLAIANDRETLRDQMMEVPADGDPNAVAVSIARVGGKDGGVCGWKPKRCGNQHGTDGRKETSSSQGCTDHMWGVFIFWVLLLPADNSCLQASFPRLTLFFHSIALPAIAPCAGYLSTADVHHSGVIARGRCRLLALCTFYFVTILLQRMVGVLSVAPHTHTHAFTQVRDLEARLLVEREEKAALVEDKAALQGRLMQLRDAGTVGGAEGCKQGWWWGVAGRC